MKIVDSKNHLQKVEFESLAFVWVFAGKGGFRQMGDLLQTSPLMLGFTVRLLEEFVDLIQKPAQIPRVIRSESQGLSSDVQLIRLVKIDRRRESAETQNATGENQ